MQVPCKKFGTISFLAYRQVHQVQLAHPHMLFAVRIFLATLYSDCEDCVGSRAVEIHVCRTNMPCLKTHNKTHTNTGDKKNNEA